MSDKQEKVFGANATDAFMVLGVQGDTVERFSTGDDGTLEWGAGGSSALDTNLYRSAAATLKTDGNLVVAGTLTRTGGSVNAPIAIGSTLTLTAATHAGKTMLFDTLAGSVATLPAATGSGAIYRFKIKTVATSNSHKVQVANGTDVIQGIVYSLSDNAAQAVIGWAAGASDDTITLNRTTTGGISKGEFIEIEDIASGVFAVTGFTQSSGTEATPFSSAV